MNVLLLYIIFNVFKYYKKKNFLCLFELIIHDIKY